MITVDGTAIVCLCGCCVLTGVRYLQSRAAVPWKVPGLGHPKGCYLLPLLATLWRDILWSYRCWYVGDFLIFILISFLLNSWYYNDEILKKLMHYVYSQIQMVTVYLSFYFRHSSDFAVRLFILHLQSWSHQNSFFQLHVQIVLYSYLYFICYLFSLLIC